MLYLFIALWIMSIFGNYGDLHQWERMKQIELFHWSLLFGLAACGWFAAVAGAWNHPVRVAGQRFVFPVADPEVAGLTRLQGWPSVAGG